ncbi:hypothetical protein [Streptomyces albireticuli]|uniref:DUF4034 domain-containing protein n=1 Tax=Streptomyces albireticuli TaxID=1940 RepID=A0A2A2D150_9ACTN|nr:hypothetical protein [Streptomyces albireticuli]MCD9146068.1 hypothetical protein [Streptomyces albireticuli]MCD9166270.1 hypothetical protein [Streptomyces albireticuli]MCD9196596.1 hypothetical protein [Streptomyces albireticuli]PAU45241.1 hypothetical protein CK936_30560 [Streptomyces albireticuli]
MRGEHTATGLEEFRPVYHPAGFDHALRVAVEEVRAGRWIAMRDLLARTGTNWPLRSARTQVLGVVAAGSTTVEAWATEERDNPEARVMWARVLVQRAQRAHRKHYAGVQDLELVARQACWIAAEAMPADPVPWVCLLALARLDEFQQRPEHRMQPWEYMLPPGPWGLLRHVWDRDQCSREAFHRMFKFLSCCTAGGTSVLAVDFGRWVASWAPDGSALLALPLYAYAESHHQQLEESRRKGRVDPLLRRQWADDPARGDAARAFHRWFAAVEHQDPATRSVPDLSHLAFALWAGHRYIDAAMVFDALGPYAALQPWGYVTDDPNRPEMAEAAFVRARQQCLAARKAHRTKQLS